MSVEPTLAEPPVPLALARLQGRLQGRAARGLRAHRPSLPLASLAESADESSRRFSDDPFADTDDDEVLSDFETSRTPPRSANGRRASDAVFAERYRKLTEFDDPLPTDTARRASLVTPAPGGVLGAPAEKGRRRSWAARLQLERKKRRKSGGTGGDTDDENDAVVYVRQKRPSWWNVFVPDNVLKNR
ncbi:hypothetical protein EVAR_36355_1 [Eumeta japonica]|uniref:Uncharacterized protein n=1 Tax=Eumeta variegata TaxID=151549 RepID=A0A4C1W4B9_EUMVA|nr:hypothetical protein EVAR_36355_1 [Eumeta japonica]